MIKLFGSGRTCLDAEGHEWAVWVSSTGDVTAHPSVEAALVEAAEVNAAAASLWHNDTLRPVSHALVLRRGYAWSAVVEHRLGRDCGVRGCVVCGADRRVADEWVRKARF